MQVNKRADRGLGTRPGFKLSIYLNCLVWGGGTLPILYMFSTSKVTLNFQKRPYRLVSDSRQREQPSERWSPQGHTFQQNSETQSTNRNKDKLTLYALTMLIPKADYSTIPGHFSCCELESISSLFMDKWING